MANTRNWTPEQHHTEAQRLTNLARQAIIQGAPIGYSTHQDVAVLALLHATMALYQPAAASIPAEHPMRCNATAPAFFDGDHQHHCDHPASQPDVDGAPEHHCGICGCTWTERVAELTPSESEPHPCPE